MNDEEDEKQAPSWFKQAVVGGTVLMTGLGMGPGPEILYQRAARQQQQKEAEEEKKENAVMMVKLNDADHVDVGFEIVPSKKPAVEGHPKPESEETLLTLNGKALPPSQRVEISTPDIEKTLTFNLPGGQPQLNSETVPTIIPLNHKIVIDATKADLHEKDTRRTLPISPQSILLEGIALESAAFRADQKITPEVEIRISKEQLRSLSFVNFQTWCKKHCIYPTEKHFVDRPKGQPKDIPEILESKVSLTIKIDDLNIKIPRGTRTLDALEKIKTFTDDHPDLFKRFPGMDRDRRQPEPAEPPVKRASAEEPSKHSNLIGAVEEQGPKPRGRG